MNEIINLAMTNEKTISYINEIKSKKSPISILGLTDIGKIYFSALTKKVTNNIICVITYNEIQAKRWVKDLQSFSDGVFYFPKKEIVTYDYLAESMENAYNRIEVLNKLEKNEVKVLVTTIEAVMQDIIPKSILYKNKIKLEVGSTYSLEILKRNLVELGYERYDLIEGKGQFSVRGGIVDISLTDDIGIRIEFWGDDVDSIRYFNISSQRSIEEIKKIEIFPSSEYVLEKDVEEICKIIEKNNKEIGNLENVLEDIEQIKQGNIISKIDKYFESFYTNKSSIIEYLPKNTIVMLDEFEKINARVENIQKDNKLIIQNLVERKKVVPDILLKMRDINEIEKELSNMQKVFIDNKDIMQSRENIYSFKQREVNFHKSTINILLDEAKSAISNKKYVVVLGGKEEQAKRILQILKENGVKCKYSEKLKELNQDEVIVTTGELSAGLEDYNLNLLLINASSLLKPENRNRRKVPSAFKQGEQVVFADLKIGDYIVHKTNGIGQFIGVNTIKTDGVIKDYIKIRYRDNGILYIPTDSLDNIRKYIGGGEGEPKLNKLGSKEWSNTKEKVKKNLREIARNLIELYAKRQKVKGYAFSKDTPWQKEFEDAFPYVETDDQLRCIEEVKKDMEKEKPMDRLLCGDVGYGKTEVAIRAAFKACMDQKQVAYLVPTTVLANQQYEAFKNRMDNFAIKVELLNRFRTKKEQNDVIKKLKLGEIDVVIGTHRLLSKDVEFKDLGLLIIDEEHRFGVKDKEKIKELKTSIDILTMTATPIPRTLQMSVVGVRDMSVIYEPPQNRKPVQTYVLPYDEEVVKEAIIKELERNGQVFYLFNTVENIVRKVEEIENLVPEAKVGFAHGQMTGNELESVMLDFIEGKINVLVCTTILESGIDIPNANTIIVENADKLGLAQLYQIRGRVGRSDVQSFAYITYKSNKLLSEVADKRLKAMKEFTEFGSGFKIAMRDLEIRGAGSLLGEIQHGHLEQVGYETYCKLLDEVIKEMQGEKIEEEIDVQIDLNISSYIPDEYIQNSSQKIEVYQNIALCRTEEDIQNIIDELIDRYGSIPDEVLNLINIAKIKELCKKANIIKLSQKMQKIIFYFDKNKFNLGKLEELIKEYKNKIKFSQG